VFAKADGMSHPSTNEVHIWSLLSVINSHSVGALEVDGNLADRSKVSSVLSDTRNSPL
jgi:hypothetical protein